MKLIQLLPLVLLCGCIGGESRPVDTTEKKQGNNSSEPSPIATMEVRITDTPEVLDISGKVQPDPSSVVHILPPASGRLAEIAVRAGDRVHQGQTIAVIQSSDIAAAHADYVRAKVEAERSNHAEKRAALLFQHEVLPEKEYDEARAQAAQAQNDLERTSQRLRMLGVDETSVSDRVIVRSPREGVVLELSAAAGELSRSLDNSTSLITIADLTRVWIVGDVFEKDLRKVAPGTPVKVTLSAYPGEEWRGAVASLSDALDPTTRTAKVRLVLPNPDRRLKPEMFATIRIYGKPHASAMLPATAVLRDGSAAFVYVQQGNAYKKQPVSLGRMEDKTIEVMDGLRGGETVVVSGAELIGKETGE